MDTPPNTPHATPEMAKTFAEFLDHALPQDGGRHTVVLGESHAAIQQIIWLHQHLDALKDKYGITTIGVEFSTAFNPLFWAYQDGSLARALGSQEMARNYVTAIMLSAVDQRTITSTLMTTMMLFDVMDRGIRIVAHDCRDRWLIKPKYQTDAKHFDLEYSQAHRVPESSVRHNIRTNSNQLRALLEHEDKDRCRWLIGELAWLRQLNPDYAMRMNAIDSLATVGCKKIDGGKITSDALSATLFDAMAAPSGNRLAIVGYAHMNGIGDTSEKNKIEKIHGTFGHHLFAAGQPAHRQRQHRVSRAVIATNVEANFLNLMSQSIFDERPNNYAVNEESATLLNLNTERTSKMWSPSADHARLVPLERKFPPPNEFTPGYSISSKKRAEHVAGHINPLLLPKIKDAADAVRRAMNPELEQVHQR